MYCTVRFLDGFSQTLTYAIPPSLVAVIVPGMVVTVPLRTGQRYALVVALHEVLSPQPTFAIKALLGQARIPQDRNFYEFSRIISSMYYCSATHAYERIYHALEAACDDEPVLPLWQSEPVPHTQLTHEQQAVVDYLVPALHIPRYEPVLLHGVTGSGKTEVYKKLILEALSKKKTVLLLLPEVSLALQFYVLFAQQLPGVPLYSFHSATPVKQKRELWEQLCANTVPLLIIGVHMPVFLPLANLGLIIIDEEHEKGFLEKKAPYLNSKELALWRAKIYGVPILLGSATPSLSSLYNVQKLGWKLFRITQRFAGTFPVVRKVILTDQVKKRKQFWISTQLEEEIRTTLQKKEQIIIYLNRRGHSFFVQCKVCGFVVTCPYCSVSLTYHVQKVSTKNKSIACDKELLRCHYCDYSQPFVSFCQPCKKTTEFIKKGIGTQQGVTLLAGLFPGARIARADLDATQQKKSWRETVEAFERREIDILVGTQTISKGYHFPHVTLVGILWADLNLHFPVYNAAEITLQQLIQVAGRAGRQSSQSTVIVQALQDHPVFDFINETAYLDFCKEELEVRTLVGYPPVMRLASLELRSTDESQVQRDSEQLYHDLVRFAREQNISVEVKRPSMPAIHRINKWEMRSIVIKAHLFSSLKKVCDGINKKRYASELIIITHQL